MAAPRRLLPLMLFACGLPGGATGCNQLEGSGEITGTLNLPACDSVSGDFHLSLDFFAVQETVNNGLFLRLQHGGTGLEVSDGVLFTLYDFDAALNLQGEEMKVQPIELQHKSANDYGLCDTEAEQRPTYCPLARADLNLPTRCPANATAPLLSGEMVFTHLGKEINDRVAGSFDLSAIDSRTSQSQGELRGHFDFVVRQGHPYQPFPR